MSLPWWGWIGLLLGAALVLFFASWRHYRANVRRRFIAYLEAEHPELEIREVTAGYVTVMTPDDGEGTMFFNRLYGAASEIDTEDEQANRELFGQFAGMILEGQGALDIDAEKDRERVMPRIVLDSWNAQAAAQMGSEPIPSLPLGPEGLSIVFVLDNEHSVAYLQSEQLTDLGLTVEEALELATGNLKATFKPEVVRTVLDKNSLNVVKSMDTFDAARLLLVPSALRQGESVAALIPDRETLVLAPVPSDGDWTSLAKLAKNAADTPLWSEPLVVTHEGIAPVTV